MTGKYELNYWPLHGLGGPCRLVLQDVVNGDFDDKMVTSFEAFQETAKASSNPFLNLPYMVTPAGQTVSQSNAILRHLGRTFDRAGKTPAQQAAVDEVIDTLADYKKEYVKMTYADADKKDDLWASFEAETVPYYFGGMDKYFKGLGTDFVGGDSVSVADYLLLQDLRAYSEFKSKAVAEVVAQWPTLAAFVTRMLALPAVQRFDASPAGKLAFNGPGATWSPLQVPAQ